MARYTGGYVKLHRSILDKELYRMDAAWKIFETLLLWASYEPNRIRWMGKPRMLEPGQLVTSISEIAQIVGRTRSTTLKWLRYLVDSERIRTETGTRNGTDGTLVTIVNWTRYQSQEEMGRTLNGTPERTRAAHPSERELLTQLVTQEEEKKLRKEEIPPTPHEDAAQLKTPGLEPLVVEWQKTLGHFRISRDARMDRPALLAALKRYGAADVRAALIGIKFEQATTTFQPSKNCHLPRIFSPKVFGKLVNLGSQAQPQEPGQAQIEESDFERELRERLREKSLDADDFRRRCERAGVQPDEFERQS